MTEIEFSILNSHVAVICLEFLKSTLCSKAGKSKMALFSLIIDTYISYVAFLKQEN